MCIPAYVRALASAVYTYIESVIRGMHNQDAVGARTRRTRRERADRARHTHIYIQTYRDTLVAAACFVSSAAPMILNYSRGIADHQYLPDLGQTLFRETLQHYIRFMPQVF